MDSTNTVPAAPVESAPTPEQSTDTTPQVTHEGAEATPAPVADPERESRARSAKDRIDQLTARYREQERRAQAAEAQLDQHRRQQELHQQFTQLDAQEPQADSFDSLQSFQRAYGDWNAKRAAAVAMAGWEARMQQESARQAQFNEQAMQQQARVMQENAVIETKMSSGSKKYPDFHQVIGNPDLPTVRGTPLLEIVLAADHSEDIAYSLAKTPGALERLLALHPVQQAKEINRLDSKFSGSAPTSAPPPPPQRNGSATAVKDWNDMSTAEHVKAYRAERTRKR